MWATWTLNSAVCREQPKGEGFWHGNVTEHLCVIFIALDIRWGLLDVRLCSRQPRKEKNRLNHAHKILDFWQRVSFWDKSSLVQFSASGYIGVWIELSHENSLQTTNKHGRFTMMICGAICCARRWCLVECTGSINEAKYISILREGHLSFFCNYYSWRDWPYISGKTVFWVILQRWLEFDLTPPQKKKTIPWANNSPDMKPTEVWELLEFKK